MKAQFNGLILSDREITKGKGEKRLECFFINHIKFALIFSHLHLI